MLILGSVKVEVIIDFNGGTLTNGDTCQVIKIKKGKIARKPEEIKRKGYTLAGWKSDSLDFSYESTIKKNIIVVAQ